MQRHDSVIVISCKQKDSWVLDLGVLWEPNVVDWRKSLQVLENGSISIIRATVLCAPGIPDGEFLEPEEIMNSTEQNVLFQGSITC
jgi:hypothetical protein